MTDEQTSNEVAAAVLRRAPAAVNLTLAVALAAVVGPPFRSATAAPDQQARICRSLLLVLNPPDARISVSSSRVVGFEDGVTLAYDVEAPNMRHRFRRITCAFSRSRTLAPELIAVSSDGRTLGPARLTFLKRFWLNSPDAAKAERAIIDKR